jgi:hypothetical protein
MDAKAWRLYPLLKKGDRGTGIADGHGSLMALIMNGDDPVEHDDYDEEKKEQRKLVQERITHGAPSGTTSGITLHHAKLQLAT